MTTFLDADFADSRRFLSASICEICVPKTWWRREPRFCQRLQQLFLRIFLVAVAFLLLRSEGFPQKKARPLPPHVPGYVIVKIKPTTPTGVHTAATAQYLRQKFGALE